jgi:uncharacterized protein YsxB (DUF464 family)
MIQVRFFYRKNRIQGFQIQGHSGLFGRVWNRIVRKLSGRRARHKDYICSAVSAVSYMAVIGLSRVLGKKLSYRENSSGFLECSLEQEPEEGTEVLFRSLEESLGQISRDYPGHIRMENKSTEETHGA